MIAVANVWKLVQDLEDRREIRRENHRKETHVTLEKSTVGFKAHASVPPIFQHPARYGFCPKNAQRHRWSWRSFELPPRMLSASSRSTFSGRGFSSVTPRIEAEE